MYAKSPNEQGGRIGEEGRWATTNLCYFCEVQMKNCDSKLCVRSSTWVKNRRGFDAFVCVR